MAPRNKNNIVCDEDLEDLELKEELESKVNMIMQSDPVIQKIGLEFIRKETQTLTSSLEVAKPIKFLRHHYGTLKAYYETMVDSYLKKLLADVISVLALTMSPKGERESLKYALLGTRDDVCSGGENYIRNLATEIMFEYAEREAEDDIEDWAEALLELAMQIARFFMKHNSESDAVDLLMKMKEIKKILDLLDIVTYTRTSKYILCLATYLPDYRAYLVDFVYMIFRKFEDHHRALSIALFLDNMEYAEEVLRSCRDMLQKKQLCLLLGQHGSNFLVSKEMVDDDKDIKMLQEIIGRTQLSEAYLTVANDIDVMEPKSPTDIYKFVDGQVDGPYARTDNILYIAATLVNAFVNAGFGQDILMDTHPLEASNGPLEHWIYYSYGPETTTAIASLGVIRLWDLGSDTTQKVKAFYNDLFIDISQLNFNHYTAGIVLGIGIMCCGVKNACNYVWSCFSKYTDDECSSIRIGAIMSLGLVYAGTNNLMVGNKLRAILQDENAPLDVIAFAAISSSLIFVGSEHIGEVSDAIKFAAATRRSESCDPFFKFLPLSHSLLYLGKQGDVNELMDASSTFGEYKDYYYMTVLSCAYAGSGDVVKVQELLGECEKCLQKEDTHQGAAVIGIAMVAMAEEMGTAMAIRSMQHLFQYGGQNIRRAVPLALGLLSISNPEVNVMQLLSRYTHEPDESVASAAIISLGLIGAGTNNARIAHILRRLADNYNDNIRIVFFVRIAQGLLHLGKGLLTLAPYHSERFLLCRTALAGIIIVLHSFLHMESIILGDYHYVLYFLVLAMRPRFLMTVDDNLKPLPVLVRVGQAVDVVGKAGQPNTITGFRTCSTPAILAAGERAEFENDKYISLSPILEGFVILKENPGYREDMLGSSLDE